MRPGGLEQNRIFVGASPEGVTRGADVPLHGRMPNGYRKNDRWRRHRPQLGLWTLFLWAFAVALGISIGVLAVINAV